jgi:hypothetical protein
VGGLYFGAFKKEHRHRRFQFVTTDMVPEIQSKAENLK